MKKILLSLIVVAFAYGTTNAQMWLTVKGGGGISTVMGYETYQHPFFEGATEVKPGISFQGGIGYKHQISKRLELEGDILFDSRSFLFPLGVLNEDSVQTYFTAASTYLQVPITLRYNIPFKKKELIPYRVGQPKSGWFIEGGPYVAYGTSVTSYVDSTIVALWADTDGDSITTANQQPRKIDVGVTAGIGLTFPINEGNTRIIVGVRGNYGLLNMYKDVKLGKATNVSAIGYLAVDFSLTKREHIRHRW